MINIRHPDYDSASYKKWRLTYEAGPEFVNAYLRKFSPGGYYRF